MRGPRRRHLLAQEISRAVIAACLFAATEAGGTGDLSGRLYLTYQQANSPRSSQEVLRELVEATLRDRLYRSHDLRLNFYFRNDQNLTNDLTLRRYRAELDVAHRYYNASVRWSPKQKVTPIELEASQEAAENQVVVDIHVPKAPRLRVLYGTQGRYDLGVLTGRNEEWRGDLTYHVKMFDFELNRWYTESKDGHKNSTTVTGGSVRLTQPFGSSFLVRTGYDYQLAENRRNGDEELAAGNHTFNAAMNGNYRQTVTGSFSVTSHRLVPREEWRPRVSDDNLQFMSRMFPRFPLHLDLGWSYLRSKLETRETLADYATAQLVLEGEPRKNTFGTAQLTKRFVIEKRNGIIPANLFFVSLRSRVRDGVEAHGELNVSQQDEDFAVIERYQSYANLRLFLRPTRDVQINPEIQFIKHSDEFSLSRFERRVYKLVALYSASSRMNAGVNLRKNVLTNGTQQEEVSTTFTLGIALRDRSTLNLAYGINDREQQHAGSSLQVPVDSRATTLNVQGVVWITKRGSLSGNYTRVDREQGSESSYTSVVYRQEF